MQSSSYLSIDLSAIYDNLKTYVASFGNVMVMVKANAYGTDPLLLCKFLDLLQLCGIPYVGVSHVSEGINLREAGIKTPIFVISAPAYEADLAAAYQLTCAVSALDEVEQLNAAAKKYGKVLPVHLHLDTGMNRFGISKERGLQLYQAIADAPHLYFEGMMTHFVASDTPEFDTYTQKQIAEFKAFLDCLPITPRWIHAANSAGAVRFNLPFCNLVRIGLGFTGLGACLVNTKQALAFSTKLSFVSPLNPGESVGYNRAYINQAQKGRIGVIPVGYYDGLLRSISGKGYVLIRGKKAPMIGTICMDYMMVDLNELPEAKVGDEVLIFGPALSPELLAAWGNTDVRELLVSMPSRVKRVWTDPPLLTSSRKIENETSAERLSGSFLSLKKNPPSR